MSTCCALAWVFPVDKLASECMVFVSMMQVEFTVSRHRRSCLHQTFNRVSFTFLNLNLHLKELSFMIIYWCWMRNSLYPFPNPRFQDQGDASSVFNCSRFIHEWIFYPLHHYWNIWTDKYIVCGMGNEAIGPWSSFFCCFIFTSPVIVFTDHFLYPWCVENLVFYFVLSYGFPNWI